MGAIHQLEVELRDRHNRTLVGSLVIESLPGGGFMSPTTVSDTEEDPRGAGSYVIAVVLIYGLSIVFLIGSHVFIKKKEESIHGDEGKIVERFFQNSSHLRDLTNRETYRKLKSSIVPIIAQSPARDLISRRKSFLPFLAGAGILIADPGGIMSGLKDGEKSPEPSSPTRKVSATPMPSIGEEEEDIDCEDSEEEVFILSDSSEDLEHALRGVERGYSGDSTEFDLERESHFAGPAYSAVEVLHSQRWDRVDRLSHARGYLHKIKTENSALPQRSHAPNMYKIVWVSADGSARSSQNSLSGDRESTARVHKPRRSSLSSHSSTATASRSGRWSVGEIAKATPPQTGDFTRAERAESAEACSIAKPPTEQGPNTARGFVPRTAAPGEVPRIAPPPSASQRSSTRRGSNYGVYVPQHRPASSAGSSSGSHDHDSIKITSL